MIGSTINHRRVTQKLGAGGMGEVRRRGCHLRKRVHSRLIDEPGGLEPPTR